MSANQQTKIDWKTTGERLFEVATILSGAYIIAHAANANASQKIELLSGALDSWLKARARLDEQLRTSQPKQQAPKVEAPPIAGEVAEPEPWDGLEIELARATLCIDRAATVDDIRSAFRRKLIEVHPDRGGDAEATRNLIEARDLLLAHAGKCE